MGFAAGIRFGPYEIQHLLGAGGMGEVYAAWDERLRRHVALKVLPSEFAADSERRLRFEQEARAVGALNHPNILVIYDIGTEGTVPFMVTEFLDGVSLRALIAQGIAARTAIAYGIQIASGLAAAHDRSIIHRDLKPENVFVTADGNVKILDFGLAKATSIRNDHNSQIQTLTETGMIVGTVAYMSPEQARGLSVDARSDIFSAGTVIYEMLTGCAAFKGASPADTLSSILRDDPDFSAVTPFISPEASRILLHCLEKDPGNRFQSARDLAFALRIVEADFLRSDWNKKAATERVDEKHSSIAVLPFTDLSPEKDQEYFCDGVTEELISTLAKIDGLRVASRTSTFQFKGRDLDIRRIGQQLGVNTILEGSVRKSGSHIRITAELISANDGYHIWSEKYDRDLKDVFVIQDEIAGTIVDTLKGRLVLSRKKSLIHRYTENQEAYSVYLKGRFYWNKRYQEGLFRAIDCFQQAIDKDPAYALAYAGLADCYSVLGFYAFLKPVQAYENAKAAAEKALQIDPDLPEAHSSMGAVHFYFECEWEKGDKEMARALELNPDFALGHCWYGGFLALTQRPYDARKHIEQAIRIDPLSPLYADFSGLLHLMERQYDQCLRELQKSLELDPNFVLALWHLGFTNSKRGNHDQAIEVTERVCRLTSRSPFFVSYLGYCYGEAGRSEDAQKIIQELRERASEEYIAPMHFARVHAALGQTEKALDELERAIEEKSVMIYFMTSPEWDSVRSHPRHKQLLHRIHWRA